MPKGLHEISGLELIERISSEYIKKRDILDKVWSKELNCWGFFGKTPTTIELLTIIGCAKIGDAIYPKNMLVWKSLGTGLWQPYAGDRSTFGIITKKAVDEKDGMPIIKLSFFEGGSKAGIYDIFISQKEAYQTAWIFL